MMFVNYITLSDVSSLRLTFPQAVIITVDDSAGVTR